MFSNVPAIAACLPDPAAPGEVVQRVDGEDDPALAPEPLDVGVDLLVGRATLEAILEAEREQCQAGGHRAAVDRTHLAAPSSPPASRALSTVPERVAGMCSERIRSYCPSPR